MKKIETITKELKENKLKILNLYYKPNCGYYTSAHNGYLKIMNGVEYIFSELLATEQKMILPKRKSKPNTEMAKNIFKVFAGRGSI